MSKSLEGKAALITGGSRGIGKATAFALAKEGASVMITYVRKRSIAEKVQSDLAKLTQAKISRCHIERREEVKECIKACHQEFGSLDIVVNNAVSAVLKPFMLLTDKHWQYTLDISLNGFFYLAQEAYPFLKETKGTLISITSLGSRKALPGYSGLGACKAALEALARQLAWEWGTDGIRVNVVCGGPVETEALRAIPGQEKLKKTWVELTPLGRMGQPEDIAAAVALLASPSAKWITGETLLVDGGLSVR